MLLFVGTRERRYTFLGNAPPLLTETTLITNYQAHHGLLMPTTYRNHLLIVAFLPAYIYVGSYLLTFSATFSSFQHPYLRQYSSNVASKINHLLSKSPRAAVSYSRTMSSNLAPIKFVPRRSGERGHADHGWLKTFHTFSFAMYQSNEHNQFGSLRVINEDRVAPGTGFGTHSHREFEIFSYIVAGELEHKDSMGNTEILKRGDIQLTSAGKGISHSEKAHGPKEVHFLQIWSLPSIRGLTPKYFTRHFSDEEKKDVFVRVVAPVDAEGVIASREGAGPAPVQSPLTLFATLLSPSKSVTHTFERRKSYIHVVQTSGYQPPHANTGGAVRVLERGIKGGEEVVLREGDGAYMLGESGKELVIENLGDKVTEILLFDLE